MTFRDVMTGVLRTSRKIAAAIILASADPLFAEDAGAGDGGIVTSPVTGKVIRVINRQSVYPAGRLRDAVNRMETILQFPFEVKPDNGDSAANVGIRIFLTDTSEFSALLLEPEAGKATVNVRALMDDRPGDKLLFKRVEREIWRGLAFIAGGGDADFPCLMRTVTCLRDLDAYPFVDTPSPLTMGKLEKGAAKHGVLMYMKDTYRQAVREGWAPAPTNDVQRAIWEEVKENKDGEQKKGGTRKIGTKR